MADNSATTTAVQPTISVLVTCFEECKSIVATLADLVDALRSHAPAWDIIIIDDASTDESVAVIESYLAKNPGYPIRLISRRNNVGFVRNVFEGAQIATGKYFWVVSGDSTVPRDAMAALLSKLGSADILIPNVVGYMDRTLLRRILSANYARLVRLVAGSEIKYFNGGSIYLREDFHRELGNVSGFSYSAEIILRLVRAGRTYIEVPVTYREGDKDHSTAVSWKHLYEVARFFLRLLRSRTMPD